MAVVTTEQELERLLPKCGDESVLVIDRLYENRQLWKRMTEEPEATVMFDLYYCGIVLFNKKRTKIHYTINF